MDPGVLIGMIIGGALILVSIIFEGGASSIPGYINMPAMMITIGGTLAATIIRFPIPMVIGAIAVVKKSVFVKLGSAEEEITRLIQYCKISRREGLLGLEKEIEKIKDEFLIKAVRLLVDGSDSDTLRGILGTEIDNIKQRHATGKGIIEFTGTVFPAFGMVGTVLGLIAMMRKLDDPSHIGEAMAVAFIATFYGVTFSNLILLPLGGRLDTLSKKELFLKEIIMEGVISIQRGDSPMVLEEKLKAFLQAKVASKLTAGSKEKEKAE
ncbi:MAG TPA: motility protein A [Candidatus Wunengus sp. YC60]|uniref:motility protein A n=1 Tax=Candidatus Wunengus sp. YC60 TaxID=3367697 RepID=UPI0040264234